MEKAIPFALAASACTATSSVCQRLGARDSMPAGFDFWLIFRLARRPIWLLGILSMILGFVFQLEALHYGPLALVQPILALELLFVFGYMAILSSRRRVAARDWLAATAMSAGLGLLLFAAAPSGGREHAPGYLWFVAGALTLAVVLGGLALAFTLHRRSASSVSRQAAIPRRRDRRRLGLRRRGHQGIQLSSRRRRGRDLLQLVGVRPDQGPAPRACCWRHTPWRPGRSPPPSRASRSSIRSRPSLLGMFLFNEHVAQTTGALALEALALGLIVGGVTALSHSHLIGGETETRPADQAANASSIRERPSTS